MSGRALRAPLAVAGPGPDQGATAAPGVAGIRSHAAQPPAGAPMVNAALAVRRYEYRTMAAARLRSQRSGRKAGAEGLA